MCLTSPLCHIKFGTCAGPSALLVDCCTHALSRWSASFVNDLIASSYLSGAYFCALHQFQPSLFVLLFSVYHHILYSINNRNHPWSRLQPAIFSMDSAFVFVFTHKRPAASSTPRKVSSRSCPIFTQSHAPAPKPTLLFWVLLPYFPSHMCAAAAAKFGSNSSTSSLRALA
jgi:hypothetical protein